MLHTKGQETPTRELGSSQMAAANDDYGATSNELNQMFIQDLAGLAVAESSTRTKPLLVSSSPGLPRLQAYLWQATSPFERQVGATKIQITLPGVPRGSRIHISQEAGRMVVFGGFSRLFDVWILWDAELLLGPEGLSYSRNLQAPVDALTQATGSGVSITRKIMRVTAVGKAEMTIVACQRSCLVKALKERFQLNIARQIEDNK